MSLPTRTLNKNERNIISGALVCICSNSEDPGSFRTAGNVNGQTCIEECCTPSGYADTAFYTIVTNVLPEFVYTTNSCGVNRRKMGSRPIPAPFDPSALGGAEFSVV